MKLALKILLSLLFLTAIVEQPQAQDQLTKQIDALPWQASPAVGNIGTVARISLANNLRFLDATATSKFLELNGNPPRANNYALAPRSFDWFAVFAFDATGYIKDDEKLEANDLLQTLKQQNEKAIEERRKLNLPILRLTGWAIEPHYDLETRRLEWGTRLVTDNGEDIVNYAIRILGRAGVMTVVLVSDRKTSTKTSSPYAPRCAALISCRASGMRSSNPAIGPPNTA
jgi:uncharacterized membrane-anchored protein